LKLGVQSASEEYRRKNLIRFETNADIIKVSELCHKYNLSFSFDHIFNLPGETEQDLIEAVDLYLRCKPTIINFGSLIYLPGTDIIKLGLKHKILTKKDVDRLNRGDNLVYKLANIDLISYQYKHNRVGNISVFALLFMMITTVPAPFIRFLMKRKIYRFRGKVPQIVLVFFKVLAKIRAGQFYIYRYFFKSLFYFTFAKKKNLAV
jgi:radical SAM superfamily enzyme YgiQ (UPF0313 family)